ncbi:MAG TPA: histidine kinase [Streptosporangiaceae bacterium]
MAEPYPSSDRGRWPGARFVVRIVRRTLAESLYLLIAPVIITAALLGALAGRPGGAGPGSRRWAAVAHALLVLPVALVTWVVTALWWFAGSAAATDVVRNPLTPKAVEGTALGLVLLCVLPLVTRLCIAVLVGLGPALLGEAAALHRRIGWPGPAALRADPGPADPGPAALYRRIGLPGPDPGPAPGPAGAVTADAAALRRLERDIHDGPQQRLVRLAMDLGRAQHNLASRPEAAQAALADAIAQTQETLDELRALSRGIAPPVLADRGLPAALAALAARSTIPAETDAGPLGQRLDPAVETAAYFVIAEALANAAKHSHARRCAIGLRHGHRTLRVWLTDDGVGGAALVKGHGLRGLDHRLHAVGGRLTVTSPAGGPTTIAAELPCC